MPIEKENLMISSNIIRPIFERLAHYVRQLNFLGPVSRGYEILLAGRNKQQATSRYEKHRL